MENNLSTILSQLMSEKGLNSAQLARKTGIGQPVIYRIMTGVTDNPQILTLKPLADFFGISIDQLIGTSSMSSQKFFDSISSHALTNKLTTIKTITSVLVELVPSLIDGYKKAVAAKLTTEEISADILPLLLINTVSLLKSINQLQEMITPNNIIQDES